MSTPYDDIIHLEHHVSPTRQPMSMRERAAQFSSFAALTGYEDAVAESGRRTEAKYELDEAEQAELNRTLCRILSLSPDAAPQVTITYFVPDERKAGGSYRTVTGTIAKLDRDRQNLVMTDGTLISVREIASITEKTPF